MTRAVVFDLDGTLIDSLPDIAHAANALLADEGLEALPQSQIGGFVGLGERVFLDRLIAATALDPAQYDRLMPRFIAHYKGATSGTVVFDGVRDALRVLRQDGCAIGLCTNKPSGPLDAVLKALDLAPLFDVIVAGDTLPVRKPNPEPLLHAFRTLGASEAVYVGDSPVDAEAAQNAGVPFLLFTEGIRTIPVSDIPHDGTFNDFKALAESVNALWRPLQVA